MQQAWNLKDESVWEKVRYICYYLANTMFWKKPVTSITDVFKIPSIDVEETDMYDKLREKLLMKTKQFDLLINQ